MSPSIECARTMAIPRTAHPRQRQASSRLGRTLVDQFYENGERLVRKGDYIWWVGWTVVGGVHERNHKIRLYDDGKVMKGKYNSFSWGWKEPDAAFFKEYLKEWLDRIKTKREPYWDVIDGKPVSK
jgi:hypothetical protein